MNYLKPKTALLIIILFLATPVIIIAQTDKERATQKEAIQKVLDKIKKLKDDGKKDDDAKIKELAKEAITLADKYIKNDNLEDKKEPKYDPDEGGDGATSRGRGKDGKPTKKIKVTLGPSAFSSPGWLISTKMHEIIVHGGQAASGRWYTDAKGDNINEVEAYDAELADSTKNGLTREEIDELLKRRKAYYDDLDAANQKKIDKEKKDGEPYKHTPAPADEKHKKFYSMSPTFFVSGTVLSEDRTTVSVRGTKFIEGVVVTAELNGKKTTARTDKNGSAIIDIAMIAGGLTGTAVAIIKTFDSRGTLLTTANTTVQPGTTNIFNRPTIESLPDNLSAGEAITIRGQNLGAESRMIMGDQLQQTLSASDNEITVFCQSNTGTQPAYVVTPGGVSQSQMVNLYALDFALPKTSISSGELVNAHVTYTSIPVGTKLIFTNMSPSAVNMMIPGAENTGTTSIFTVHNTNGTIPVNVTGITRGNFKIALDLSFKNNNQTIRNN